jgi:D-alanyl-D-alanine dipeptidase
MMSGTLRNLHRIIRNIVPMLLVASLPIAATAQAQQLHPAFVDAASVVPGLEVDMRYAGTNNFVGAKIAGYEKPVCLLTKEAAAALAKAQIALASSGVGLKVFDCYRPARAVAHFVHWSRDLKDVKAKGDFYPDLDKRTLFRDGYISQRSGHSRGSTVDLTLVDILPGPDGKLRERDMGTPFDFFSPYSSPSDRRVNEEARSNRKLLADAMRKAGFVPYGKEWWHFTLAHEPFPQTYFDFAVK